MKPLLTLSILFAFITFKATSQKVLWQDYTINKDSYSFATAPTAITTDRAGNVIVSGDFQDSIAFGPHTLNTGTFYLVKYNSTGKVQWALSNNSIHNASTNSVATDSHGNIYLTGTFSDTLKIGSVMIVGPRANTSYMQSFFLAKFDPNGNTQWIRCSSSNYYGGSSDGESVTVDHSNNVYVTGTFRDTVQVGGFVAGCSYWYTGIFVAKYSPSGNPLWLNMARAGNASGYGASLYSGVDSINNIYVSGEFGDTIYCGSYIVPTSTSSLGGSNIYLLKFDSSGNNKWAKVPGVMLKYGSAVNYSSASYMSMCSDSRAYLYITAGYVGSYKYGSYVFPAITNNQGLGFLVKLNLDGVVLWAECDKPGRGSCGTSLSSDGWGNIYLGGWAEGNDTLGGISLGQGGFVAKFDGNGHGLCGTNINPVGWYSFNGVSANPFLPVVNIASTDQYGLDGFKADTVNTNGGGYTAEWTCDTCRAVAKMKGDSIVCMGQATQLSASNGTSYLWSTGATTSTLLINPTATTTYTLYIMNGACYGDTTFSIRVNPMPTAGVSGTQTICAGTEDTLRATGGITYTWGNGATTSTIIISPDSSALYKVSVSNGPCSVKDSINVKVFQFPVPIISKADTLCLGKSVNVSASGGTNYTWLPSAGLSNANIPSPVATPTSTTEYTVTISNGPCSAKDSVDIIVHPVPIPTISPEQKICSGNSATLSVSGGAQYIWNNGGTTSTIIVNPLTNITYSVSVSNGFCSATDSVKVLVYSYPIAVITNNQYICSGNSTSLSVSGGMQYIWSNGDTSSTISVSPSLAKIYSVTLYDGPCSVKDSVTVFVNPLPIANACCDTSIMYGQNVQLTSSGGITYNWLPASGLNCSNCFNPIASPPATTIYTLTVVSDSGCSASTTITIAVSCGTVFIPEAFSPNGDGQNDNLYVRGDCIETLDFTVFDRWGNVVFKTNNKSIPWNGIYKGEPMSTGSYAYSLNATLYDGTTVTKKGNVVLVR